jgi:hypothetical protein
MLDVADGNIIVGDKPKKSRTSTIVEDLAARAGAFTHGWPANAHLLTA